MKKFDPNKPFNDLPMLPPAADLKTRTVLKKSISAGRMLAELKGLGETIPNQGILINSLTLQEAKASSEIENVITTNDALFKAFTASTSQVDPATKEVLRYREALWEGFNKLKSKPFLTTHLLVRLIQSIKKITLASVMFQALRSLTLLPARPSLLRRKVKRLFVTNSKTWKTISMIKMDQIR